MARTMVQGASWSRNPRTVMLTWVIVTACICNGLLLLAFHKVDHTLPHVKPANGHYAGSPSHADSSNLHSAWTFHESQQHVRSMTEGNPTKIAGVMQSLTTLTHQQSQQQQQQQDHANKQDSGHSASTGVKNPLTVQDMLYQMSTYQTPDQKTDSNDFLDMQGAALAALFNPRPKRQVVHKTADQTTEVVEMVEIPTTISDPMVELPDQAVARAQTEFPVWWFAPFFDRTSFGKEAATLVLGMMRSGAMPEDNIWIGTSQGDCNYGVDDSMPEANFKQLDAANKRWNMSVAAIAVCHSLPPFWARPKNKWETCFPCPPVGYTPAITIGRAMAETDIYHEEFVKYCNRMDEVWVPSDFSKDVLIRSGVEPDKVRVVPIAVNTTLFDPHEVIAIKLPVGDLVFGQHKRPLPGQHGQTETIVTKGELDTEPSDKDEERKAASTDPPTTTQETLQASPGTAKDAQQQKQVLGVKNRKVLPNEVTSASLESNSKRRLLFDQQNDATEGPDGAASSAAGESRADVGVSTGPPGLENGDGGTKGHGGSSNALDRINRLSDSIKPEVGGQVDGMSGKAARPRKPFVLFSCFKWEMRKGWDVLLSSYLQEFTSDDHIELYILTKPFLTGSNFTGDMQEWVNKNLPLTKAQKEKLPTLYVISNHLTDQQYSGIYKAADAFVIATRGEGWGMPISEAMSMGLPVVVTNWSGVTGFVDETTGYMVDYELSKVPPNQPWWFQGARWADAKVDSMRKRLREVYSDRKEAARRGRRARERMVTKYSPEALAFLLNKEFERLKGMLRSGEKCGSKCHNKTWVAPLGDRNTDYYTGNEPFMPKKEEVEHKGTVQATTEGGGQEAEAKVENLMDLASMNQGMSNKGLTMSLNKMVAAATATGTDKFDMWRGLVANAETQTAPLKGIVTELETESKDDSS